MQIFSVIHKLENFGFFSLAHGSDPRLRVRKGERDGVGEAHRQLHRLAQRHADLRLENVQQRRQVGRLTPVHLARLLYDFKIVP